MSNLGQMSLEGGGQEVFLGRDLMNRSEVSESISKQIDEQVRAIVMQCYEETLALVQGQREAMDQLVELLIEKETMDGDEFREILATFTAIPEKERFVPVLN